MSKDLPFDMGDHILFLTKQQVDVLRKTFILEFLDKQKLPWSCPINDTIEIIRDNLLYPPKKLKGEDNSYWLETGD